MTARQSHAVLAAASLALELTKWIEARFNLPQSNVPDLREFTPEDAAVALRARWMIGAERPVSNVVHLMELHGIRVFSLADEYIEVDGFSYWAADVPFVFLNTLKSGERGRFDAAHELGHLVLHRHAPPQGRKAEKEADEFASAFLMPASAIRRDAPRNPSVNALMQIKSVWRVSLVSLAHRLHKMELMSDWQYREAMIEISKRGWRRSEPNGIVRETSQALQKVFVALHEDGVRRADVARELRIRLADLEALVFGLVPTGARAVPVEAPTPASMIPKGTRPQLVK